MFRYVKNTARIIEKTILYIKFRIEVNWHSKLEKFETCTSEHSRFVNLTNFLHLRNYYFHSHRTVTILASIEVLELLLLNISEAKPISKCSGLFSFNSYNRGFHAWGPVLSRRYSCTAEEKNKHDEYAVAVVNDDEIVRHTLYVCQRSCLCF